MPAARAAATSRAIAGTASRALRDRELPLRVDEVDLGVDVPQHRGHGTSSSRGFGRRPRPNFADGLPSVSTMSPVKSFDPRISDDPTP